MKNTKTQKDFDIIDPFNFSFKKIGKYSLLREISKGGMGIVFESRQDEINRKIAIKVLPFSSLNSNKSIERFKREAAIVSKIKHKGVAQVFDFGNDEHGYYLVMEYIEGKTLEEKIKNEVLSFNEKLDIFIKILYVLIDLHQLNIIHRDIKPSNIMIKSNGDIVLLDFGISKCLDDEALHKLTTEPIGTPVYMPPEFIISKGHKADKKSDIYSLGVLLYELVTNDLPFNVNQTYYLILDKIIKSDFELPTVKKSDVPKNIETIILKCMAKEPSNRYSDIKILLNDIEHYNKKKIFSFSRMIVLTRCFLNKQKNKRIIMLTTFLMILFFMFFLKDKSSIFNENRWVILYDTNLNKIFKSSKFFRNIDENIYEQNSNKFYHVIDNSVLNWNSKESGFIILNSKNQNALKISFDYEILLKDTFFGAFLSSSEKLSGYLLKIKSNSIALCKNHYDNIIKEFTFKNTKKLNSIIFIKSGAELNVLLNKEKIINFIDYDPIISESNSCSGLFFSAGDFSIINLKYFRPENHLLISPLILGQRFYELNQYDNAIKEYEKIVNEYSENKLSQIAFFKMGISHMKKGEYKKALEIYNKIIASSTDEEILPQVYYQKGILLFKMDKLINAEKIFLTAINKFKASDISLNIFLFLYDMISSNFSNKISEDKLNFYDQRFRFMLEHFPSKRPLLATNIRAFITMLMNNEKFDDALFYLKKIPKYFQHHRPTLAWGEIQEGELNQKINNFDEALKIYRKAYEEYKNYSVYGAWAIFKLGELYEYLGNNIEANKVWNEIINNYKDNNEFYSKAKAKLIK